jgi:hypothetical protein
MVAGRRHFRRDAAGEREIRRGKRAEPQIANERFLGALRPLPQELQVVPGHDLRTEIRR